MCGDAELRRDALGALGLGVLLLDVVRCPALDEDGRTGLLQPARDREPDPRTPAHARDERVPPGQVHVGEPNPGARPGPGTVSELSRLRYVVRTETTSRTASDDACSACCSSSVRSSSMISSIPPGPSFTGTPI